MVKTSLIAIPFLMALQAWPAQSQNLSVAAKPGEWRYLNADPLSTRYSPLDQINKDNFKDLKIAWRWSTLSSTPPASPARTMLV